MSDERRWSKKAVMDILSEIRDPGVPMSIVEMGIVSEDWIHLDDDVFRVEFRPASPFCPVGVALGVIIKYALEENLDTEAKVRVLRGSHLQESLVNELLENRKRYLKTLHRLKSSGFVTRCYCRPLHRPESSHNKVHLAVSVFVP